MNRIAKRVALPVGAALILGSSGFAFMAANSTSEAFAGAGQNVISGYTVSNVKFITTQESANQKSSVTKDSIQYIQFDLDHGANNVVAQVNDQRYTQCHPTASPYATTAAAAATWKCGITNAGHGQYVTDAMTYGVVANQ